MLNRKCKICSKDFYVRRSLSRRGWGQCCSKECRDKSLRTGKFVKCAYCGNARVYKTPARLKRDSKTKKYFCNKSCLCAWKNKKRKVHKAIRLVKKLWGSWCSGNITRCGRVVEDSNSSGPPLFPRKSPFVVSIKRPPKKVLYNFYWKENHTQTEIANVFSATHTSVQRWLKYYKINKKPRILSCGKHPNTLKNLELGKMPEAQKKSAETRKIYSQEKLIASIQQFFQQESRIPTKRDFSRNPFYPNFATFQDYFSSWNEGIKAAGFKPNTPWFSLGTLYAKDGHVCRSLSEVRIDNWLLINNIPHDKEILYPEGKYKCDFVFGDIFVEFFGLANAPKIHSDYRGIMDKKRKLCKKYNFTLLELFEQDLDSLQKKLGKKIEKFKLRFVDEVSFCSLVN